MSTKKCLPCPVRCNYCISQNYCTECVEGAYITNYYDQQSKVSCELKCPLGRVNNTVP